MEATSVKAVCAECFWRLIGAWQEPTEPGALACWAGAPLGKEARFMWWHLLILLAPFSQSRNGLWAVWLGICYCDLVGRPKHLRSPCQGGEGHKQWSSLAPSTLENSRSSQGASTISRTSLFGLFLWFVIQRLFTPPSIVSQKNFFFYMHVYFSVLVGESEFNILLCCCHLEPHYLAL